MPKIDYFLLCETVIRDTEGRLSFINTFDALNMPEFPAIPAKFAVAFGAYIEKSDVKDGNVAFRIEIVKPNGESIVSVNGHGPVKDKTLKENSKIVAAADLAAQVSIDGPGIYKAILYINDESIRELPIEVKLKPSEKE